MKKCPKCGRLLKSMGYARHMTMHKEQRERTNVIYNGDCVDVMRNIPANSVDLTLSSPPYDNLRVYGGYHFDFEATAREIYRLTKPGGILVWVVGDATVNGSETGTSFTQALYFKEVGFNLYDTMIYHKLNPVPLNHRRYEQAFEYMFVFSKGKPKTFHPLQEKTVRAGEPTTGRLRNGGSDFLGKKHGYGKPVKPTKPRTNIWSYAVGKGGTTNDKITHPAIFPEKLASDHIESWTNPGDLVLDPLCGSGTTLKMAKALGRNYIGVEISEDYCKVAKARLDAKE